MSPGRTESPTGTSRIAAPPRIMGLRRPMRSESQPSSGQPMIQPHGTAEERSTAVRKSRPNPSWIKRTPHTMPNTVVGANLKPPIIPQSSDWGLRNTSAIARRLPWSSWIWRASVLRGRLADRSGGAARFGNKHKQYDGEPRPIAPSACQNLVQATPPAIMRPIKNWPRHLRPCRPSASRRSVLPHAKPESRGRDICRPDQRKHAAGSLKESANAASVGFPVANSRAPTPIAAAPIGTASRAPS